ncbi:hypothetical protein XENORESO_012278 [Xenotaenia resolanae]|uniref:Uncharacterized protein n=1 Tax=Xenotaenia resolanae TaxID=208358 RepID=A0ABV0WJ64_9TELE
MAFLKVPTWIAHFQPFPEHDHELPFDIPSSSTKRISVDQVCPSASTATGSNSPPGEDQFTGFTLFSPESPRRNATGLMKRGFSLHRSPHSRENVPLKTFSFVSTNGKKKMLIKYKSQPSP